VHWASCEPLLGPIKIGGTGAIHLGWLVLGSESGNGARPMEVAWARSLVDQCVENGIPVFTKQIATGQNGKGGDPATWPAGNWPRQYPEVRA
jgi:protein gp37